MMCVWLDIQSRRRKKKRGGWKRGRARDVFIQMDSCAVFMRHGRFTAVYNRNNFCLIFSHRSE